MPVTVVTSSRYYGVRRTLRRSARTPAVIKRVREKLRRNPRRSVVKLAQEEGIGRTTMTNIVTKDLGCKPYKMQKRQRQMADTLNIEKMLDNDTDTLNIEKMFAQIKTE